MKAVLLFIGDSADDLPPEAGAAIGYLSLWGDYPNIAIHRDGGSDLLAVYTDMDRQQKFVMGAVYNAAQKTYSFHS